MRENGMPELTIIIIALVTIYLLIGASLFTTPPGWILISPPTK